MNVLLPKSDLHALGHECFKDVADDAGLAAYKF